MPGLYFKNVSNVFKFGTTIGSLTTNEGRTIIYTAVTDLGNGAAQLQAPMYQGNIATGITTAQVTAPGAYDTTYHGPGHRGGQLTAGAYTSVQVTKGNVLIAVNVSDVAYVTPCN